MDLREIRKQKHDAWKLKQIGEGEISTSAARSPRASSPNLDSRKKRKTGHAAAKPKNTDVIDLSLSDDETPTATPGKTLPILTYNVWFGPPHQSRRMSAIAALVASSSPLLIGFQEVTPLLDSHLSPLLRSMGYDLHSQRHPVYGLALAFRENVLPLDRGFLPFASSQMDRGLLWIHAKIESAEILFATTHLESPVPGMGGVRERREQILESARFCEEFVRSRPAVEACVLSGDLNWDDERKRSKGADEPLLSLLGNNWRDAWKESRAGEDGYTYDAKESPMLGGNLRRRLDRVLLRFTGSAGQVVSSSIIGTDAIQGITWEKEIKGFYQSSSRTKTVPVLPSDHYGLMAVVKLS